MAGLWDVLRAGCWCSVLQCGGGGGGRCAVFYLRFLDFLPMTIINCIFISSRLACVRVFVCSLKMGLKNEIPWNLRGGGHPVQCRVLENCGGGGAAVAALQENGLQI